MVEFDFANFFPFVTEFFGEYYKQSLALDLARSLPLWLLVIIIIDPTFFSLQLVQQRISEVLGFGFSILGVMLFTLSAEWILRILYLIKITVFKK